MNRLEIEVENLRRLVKDIKLSKLNITMAGTLRGNRIDEIGFEEYHRIRVCVSNLQTEANIIKQYIQEVKDTLQKAGVKHEYSTDEKDFHVIYVPIGQKALL